MSDPTFGINIQRADTEPRPASVSDMSVIGLVGTAPDANAETFPLNQPVFMFSDDTATFLGLGETGTLPDAIQGINDQLGDFQVAAKVVVVRVEEGVDDDATIANILGNQASKTGLHALKAAGPVLGVIPRLIGVPGYTHQQKRGVSAVVIGAPGEGYEVGDAIAGTGGGGTGFAAVVSSVAGDGGITGVEVTNPGDGYSSAPTLSVTSEGGEGATLTATVEKLANPVCAALPPILSSLLAHAVVGGPATDLQDWTDWRETLSSDRLIPVETNVKVGANATEQSGVPRVLGIAVRRDHEFGGRPFHSWANQPVYGIVGPNRPIEFSLTDGATEGQTILSQNGGVIVRGEMGVETAIASGGYVFIGTDNAGEDELWRFYNVSRGRDYIHLLLLKTLRFYLGRFNINAQTIQAILDTMNFALRDLQATGDILGGRVGFKRDQNSPEQLRLGRFTVDFAAEEPPVLRYLGVRSQRYRPALDALLNDLLAQIDAAA